MGVRVSLVCVTLAALLVAPTARADSATSTNWAGYAVHRHGVSYRSIQAEWSEPTVSCLPGRPSFSSYWIGLGGFKRTSHAIEQIGTEVDCTRAGSVRSTAWYELLPAPSSPIALVVRPGDVLAARVTVAGRRVTMSLRDLTTGQGFRKTLRARVLDVTSAEWVVEAPSDCAGTLACRTLPLADFGSVSFLRTSAVQRNGHTGTISDRHWNSTVISLNPVGRRFVAASGGSGTVIGGALPGALAADGAGFAVRYAAISVPGAPPVGLARNVRLAPLQRQ